MMTGRTDVAPFGTETTGSGKLGTERFVKRGSGGRGGSEIAASGASGVAASPSAVAAGDADSPVLGSSGMTWRAFEMRPHAIAQTKKEPAATPRCIVSIAAGELYRRLSRDVARI
jgi:hypothetical protein